MGKGKQKTKRSEKFSLVRPNAAGIDVADKELVVAVSADHDEENIRTFGSFTCDLYSICSWLKSCGIDSVAMESTGVYWVQPFLVLQDQGFKVCLVNARHVKNVSGRKNDENDAMWIQKLHSCGLLFPSFQPESEVRGLRSLVRHRKNFVRDTSKYVNRIQKELEMMNIKYHTVISDIQGKTGQAILKAILGGERNAEKLAQLRDPRIKASEEEIIKSLEGFWREDSLFIIKQSYDMYKTLMEKISEVELKIQELLEAYLAKKNDGELPQINAKTPRKKTTKHKKLAFNATAYLKKLFGVDVTQIDGISEVTALEIFVETGGDMSKWPSSKHFTSWLGVTPDDKISGGKLLSSKVKKKKHSAGQAFKQAASSLYHSKSPLGRFFKKVQSRSGRAQAVVATARMMGSIFYSMVKNQTEYNPDLLNKSHEKQKEWQIQFYENQLKKLRAA